MLTVDTALETAVELIYIVAAIDATAFVFWDFVVMVVFFVSFGLASKAIDRLVIGTVR